MTSSVIGIDLGSSTSYVAKVLNGGVELLANELNSRTTPTILSLPADIHGSRMVGASAESHLVTHPNSTVSEVRNLLGINTMDVRNHRDASKFERVTSGNGGPPKLGVRLTFKGEQRSFQPEQLVASMLKNLKRIVMTDGENRSVNAESNFYVLSAPNYFTDAERFALIDAARIAQLNVVQLTNDLTAAALAYGYFQKNLPQAPLTREDEDMDGINHHQASNHDMRISAPPLSERPRLVAFVDFGHSGIQSVIGAFSANGFKLLATQTDRTVGGRDFDRRLASHFMDLFNLQHRSRGIRLRAETHPKIFAKLLAVAEKIKRQMSANRNVLPVVVECLFDDFDLNADICRDTFEQLCSDLFERVRNNLVRLLQRVRLERGALHSVEVLGGSSRIPMFKTIVEEVFEMTPSTTLNADEAVARGCALMCALNTKVFKVKPFRVIDNIHYNTQVKYVIPIHESSSSAIVSASRFGGSSSRHPAVQTVIKNVFSRNDEATMRTVIELEEMPQGNTLALEYCQDEDDLGQSENGGGGDLSLLTKPLIAIYNFEHESQPREGERLQLEFVHEFGGIVRLRAARLVQSTKRVKYDNTDARERNVRFSEVRVGGLTANEIQEFVEDEKLMEDFDTRERLREETKNRLEEFTFALRDELESVSEVVKREEAWSIINTYVNTLAQQFESDNYENSSVEVYRHYLEEIQKKKAVFLVWLQKFNQKLELETMRNIVVRR